MNDRFELSTVIYVKGMGNLPYKIARGAAVDFGTPLTWIPFGHSNLAYRQCDILDFENIDVAFHPILLASINSY
jgi:hypothetical protein